jgi:hypothetical protein
MAGAFVSKTIDFNSQRDRRFFKVIYWNVVWPSVPTHRGIIPFLRKSPYIAAAAEAMTNYKASNVAEKIR